MGLDGVVYFIFLVRGYEVGLLRVVQGWEYLWSWHSNHVAATVYKGKFLGNLVFGK